MKHLVSRLGAAALAASVTMTAGAAIAAEAVKVGLVATLSGPPAALGQQIRNGFELALKQLDGKLGGLPAELVVVDDELKPDVAVTRVKGLIERDKVDFVVGPVFSNVLMAIVKPVTDANIVLISPNAGPSVMAGANCSPLFFSTSYQNDQVHQVLGKVAQDRGYKRVYLLAPNYQAGKDSMAGFKRDFKGEIVAESYVPLNTLDFQSELTNIAALQPDAIFTFMPGGMGVNLVKQFRQAGLADKIPFLSAFTVDESTLPAQKEAAIGLFAGSNWAPNMDNPANKKFVAAYEAAYGAVPATYAFQAYDAAMLINKAVTAVGGDLADKAKLRSAILAAEIDSPRGGFKIGNNGFPIQDYYLTVVAQRPDGKFQTEIVEKVYEDLQDPYAKDCALPAN